MLAISGVSIGFALWSAVATGEIGPLVIVGALLCLAAAALVMCDSV